MGILTRLFRQQDHENAEHWKLGWENSKIWQEVVFTTIESVVILAALNIALSKEWSWVLAIIYLLAFLALTVYLQMFFKYLVNATNEKFEIIKGPTVLSWVAGTTSTLSSVGIVLLLPEMVSSFVQVNFMQ
jgi:hypothetical protein